MQKRIPLAVHVLKGGRVHNVTRHVSSRAEPVPSTGFLRDLATSGNQAWLISTGLYGYSHDSLVVTQSSPILTSVISP